MPAYSEHLIDGKGNNSFACDETSNGGIDDNDGERGREGEGETSFASDGPWNSELKETDRERGRDGDTDDDLLRASTDVERDNRFACG